MFFKRSHFPLIVIGLTAALIVLMWFAFTGQEKTHSPDPVIEQVTISADDYKVDLADVMQRFQVELGAATDDVERSAVAHTSLEQILELKVPAEYQDLHLSLVLSLIQITKAIENGESTAQPLTDIAGLEGRYPWLTE